MFLLILQPRYIFLFLTQDVSWLGPQLGLSVWSLHVPPRVSGFSLHPSTDQMFQIKTHVWLIVFF